PGGFGRNRSACPRRRRPPSGSRRRRAGRTRGPAGSPRGPRKSPKGKSVDIGKPTGLPDPISSYLPLFRGRISRGAIPTCLAPPRGRYGERKVTVNFGGFVDSLER